MNMTTLSFSAIGTRNALTPIILGSKAAKLISLPIAFAISAYFFAVDRRVTFSIFIAVYTITWLLVEFVDIVETRMAYRFGGRLAMYRDRLFRCYAGFSGIAVVYYLFETIEWALTKFLVNTPLESLTKPGLYLTSVLAGLTVTGFMLNLPGTLMQEALRARFAAEDVITSLRFGATWLVSVAFSSGWFLYFEGITGEIDHALMISKIALIGWAFIVVDVLLMLWFPVLSRSERGSNEFSETQNQAYVWLVFSEPFENREKLRLIDRLCRLWPDRAFILASPPGSKTFGEHQFWAHCQGRLKALFPTREIEIMDWQHTVPSATRSFGFRFLEIHPLPSLLPRTVQMLGKADDRVILVHDCGIDLNSWRGLLREDSTRVLNLDQTGPSDETIAGYRSVSVGDDSSMRNWFVESVQTTSKPDLNGLGSVIPSDARIAKIFARICRSRLRWPVLGGLILIAIVAAHYMFTAYQCSWDDPPFECKFEQEE